MNYIIASYAGTKYEFSLELQLQGLFTILMNKKAIHIRQVTIVCPPVKPGHVAKTHYYNKDKWTSLFEADHPYIKLVYMDYVGENVHASYDQWLQAIINYPEFDYYLLIEDDYCIHPSLLDFDVQLIKTYNDQHNGFGYLCTYADAVMGHPYHAAISNGIVSRKTIEFITERGVDLLDQYYQCANECGSEQVGFSNMFLKFDVPVYSLHTIYTAMFWSSYRNRIELYSDILDKYFFLPIQYLTTYFTAFATVQS